MIFQISESKMNPAEGEKAFLRALEYKLPLNKVLICSKFENFIKSKATHLGVFPEMFIGPFLSVTSHLMGFSEVI